MSPKVPLRKLKALFLFKRGDFEVLVKGYTITEAASQQTLSANPLPSLSKLTIHSSNMAFQPHVISLQAVKIIMIIFASIISYHANPFSASVSSDALIRPKHKSMQTHIDKDQGGGCSLPLITLHKSKARQPLTLLVVWGNKM